MKHFIRNLDKKYLKICAYAGLTTLITICLTAILLTTGSFWAMLWRIFTAVLKPIIIGGVICYLFLPIVTKIEGFLNKNKVHKRSRIISVLITFFIVLMILAIIIFMIAITVYKNVEAINYDSISTMYNMMKEEYTDLWDYIQKVLDSANISTESMKSVISAATASVSNFFSGLLFGVIFSIYFLLDEKRISTYWARVIHLLLGDRFRTLLDSISRDADNAFSGYIRGQFLDAFIVGIMSTLALLVAGIPSAGIVGTFVGIGNMIPYLGPIVGYATLAIVCLPLGELNKFLIGCAVLAVVMFIDGNVINPRLLSNAVDVHPLLVIAALIAGGAIGGVAGMLIAVPTAALVKLQFERFLDKKEKKQNIIHQGNTEATNKF